MIDRQSLGPVEILVVAFPGTQFTGTIIPELQKLVDAGTVRILDLVIVQKGEDGSVVTLELNELSPEAQDLLNPLHSEGEELFNDEDLIDAAEDLAPGTTAALLVWEDTWAVPFANAIRESGGQLIALERVPREAVDELLDALAGN